MCCCKSQEEGNYDILEHHGFRTLQYDYSSRRKEAKLLADGYVLVVSLAAALASVGCSVRFLHARQGTRMPFYSCLRLGNEDVWRTAQGGKALP